MDTNLKRKLEIVFGKYFDVVDIWKFTKLHYVVIVKCSKVSLFTLELAYYELRDKYIDLVDFEVERYFDGKYFIHVIL